MSNYSTTFHRDATITVWDVYQQQWRRMSAVKLYGEDAIMASLSQKERDRITRAAAKAGNKSARSLLGSQKKSRVTIVASISDGMTRNAGGETTFSASRYITAVRRAEQWCQEGDYTSPDSDTVDVMLVISRPSGEIIERRTVKCPATREMEG